MHRRRIARSCLALVATLGAGAVGCTSVAPPPSSTTTTSSTSTTTVAVPADAGFLAFGDAGTGDATQRGVADEMVRWATDHRVDALVEAGDDVYDVGDPSRFAATLDTPYASLRASRPLWVALGNHDEQNGFGDQQLRYLGLPDLPYTETLTNVQLLFLDANHPDSAQAQWLDARLSEPGPSFRVVVFHQPAYSCALHGSTAAVDQYWVPILEAHHVALVINGHDHYYERFLSSDGVTYVVTGGGGASLYSRRSSCSGTPPSQATAQRNHFLSVEIRGATMILTAVATDGTILDQATITR